MFLMKESYQDGIQCGRDSPLFSPSSHLTAGYQIGAGNKLGQEGL